MSTATQDVQPWIQARQRLGELMRAAQTGACDLPRSALLLGPATSVAQSPHASELRDLVQRHGATLIEFSCQQPGLVSFWATQRLLDQLGPLIASERPELLARWAAEIQAIHPDLTAALALRPERTLDELALTPAERRSHRESEQAFRVINGLASLVLDAQSGCPSLAGGPLVIWWRHLHEADRPSLLLFRRLSRWATQRHAPVVLIGSLDPQADPQPVVEGPALQPDIQRYFDWRSEHRRLIQLVRSQFLGEELALPDAAPVQEPRPTFAPLGDLPLSELNGSRAMLLAYERLHQERMEEAAVYLLHAMRLAVFALNIEAIMLLGQLALTLIAPYDDGRFDDQRFAEHWQRLTAEEHYAALEFATSSMLRHQDIIMACWKAAALAQTFLEYHETALECYQHALALADHHAMRAQLYMYIGLLTGKRLHNTQQGMAYLQQGFGEIDGHDDAEALLERGWLSNVSALMTYQQGRYREAMDFVRAGLAAIKPLHIYEATYLKINLVSNMSVLLEDTKQTAKALEIWTFFRNFLNNASASFAKHYFFREAGLRLQAGDWAAAIDCYRQSYEHAREADDGFHMEIAARAAGYACYRHADFAAARSWFGESAQLRHHIGDYDNLPESLLAQALCSYQAGQADAAGTALAEAEQLCRDLQLSWLAKVLQAQLALQHPDEGALAGWEQLALRMPSSKLNRPFYLTNLY